MLDKLHELHRRLMKEPYWDDQRFCVLEINHHTYKAIYHTLPNIYSDLQHQTLESDTAFVDFKQGMHVQIFWGRFLLRVKEVMPEIASYEKCDPSEMEPIETYMAIVYVTTSGRMKWIDDPDNPERYKR